MANILFPFPIKGQSKSMPVTIQPEYTAYDLLNVRPFDVIESRARGGQRPGLSKWGDGDHIGNGAPIVAICSVTYMEYA